MRYLLRLALFVCLSVQACLALAAAPDAPFDPSGQWVGVYQSYPYLVRMTLEIPASRGEGRGTVEADLRLEPLFQLRTIGRSPMGVVKATVEFDTNTRTLLVQPGADAYRQLGMQLPGFAGVYDSQQKVIGGVLTQASSDASPYFLLSRPDGAKAAFLSRLEAFGSGAGGMPLAAMNNPLGNLVSKLGGGSGVNDGKLREWAGQFIKEYPDVDAYNTEMGRLFVSARNLFRDESFRPYFGTTFDQMSGNSMQLVQRQLRAVPPPRGNFPEERANGVLRVMERPFTPQFVGTFTAADMVLSVLATRATTGWKAQTLERIAAAPSTVASWQLYQAADAAGANILANDWPSQRQAFASALADARSRTAGPILQARVDEMLNGAGAHDANQLNSALAVLKNPSAPARTSSVTTAAGIRRAPAGTPVPTSTDISLAELAWYAAPDQREAQAGRLAAGLSNTVNGECGGDRSSVASLGGGLSGLEANGRKYQELSRKYASLGGSSKCAVFGDLETARHALMGSAEPELTARLQKARSSDELSSITATYLGLPGDRQDAAGARLLSVANQRGGELQKQAQVEAAQHAEQRKMAACATASAQQEGAEPTERDMCMAFARTLSGQQENLQNVTKGACGDMRGSGANAGTAIMCLMGGAVDAGGGMGMSIAGFEKVACVSAAPAGKPGFFCDYTMRIVTSNPTLGSIMNRFGGETATARFVKSKGTWIVIPQPNSDN